MGKGRIPSSRDWLTPHQLRSQNSHTVFKICYEGCRHSNSVLPQIAFVKIMNLRVRQGPTALPDVFWKSQD